MSALWFSIGMLTGSILPDASLANYQWDTTPRPAWGAQALIGTGPVATGLRVWSAGTTQSLGLPGVVDPTVTSTSWEAVGRGRFANWWGNELLAIGSVGRMHLAYEPDRITINPGGTPLVVDFAPVNEWIYGAGLAVSRPFARQWAFGLEVDHRFFRMETAHRNGSVIEVGRESFGEWSARLELAWRHGR